MSTPDMSFQSDTVSVQGLDALFSENHLILTVADASAHLRIPQSSLYRQIRAGKYQAVKGDDGILRVTIPRDSRCDSHSALNENQVIIAENPSENHTGSSSEDQAEIVELRAKLEAATYRIGYLEAKLEERQNDIRLLEDSQAKHRSWWRRFFFGDR